MLLWNRSVSYIILFSVSALHTWWYMWQHLFVRHFYKKLRSCIDVILVAVFSNLHCSVSILYCVYVLTVPAVSMLIFQFCFFVFIVTTRPNWMLQETFLIGTVNTKMQVLNRTSEVFPKLLQTLSKPTQVSEKNAGQ